MTTFFFVLNSDYLIHIGSAPLPTNAADLSGGNFVQPHSEIREKVLNNPKVNYQNKTKNRTRIVFKIF